MRESDELLHRLNKDTSFALRRGTIGHVSTPLDAAQPALILEDEELAIERGGSLPPLPNLTP